MDEHFRKEQKRVTMKDKKRKRRKSRARLRLLTCANGAFSLYELRRKKADILAVSIYWRQEKKKQVIGAMLKITPGRARRMVSVLFRIN